MNRKKIFFLIIFLFMFIGVCIVYFNKEKSQLKLQVPGPSGALQALHFWSRSRAYPMDEIPSAKYYNEYRRIRSEIQMGKKSLNTGTNWQTMGPWNNAGRMISLALNPQNTSTLYAGSASGGLWRTFSAETGGNWHRIQTGFPTLGVHAIAINPTDTNTIYIGTGEVYGYKSSIGGLVIYTTRGSYGIGILKSTDGGTSWIKSLDWTTNQERGVQCIRINPLDPNTLYAATSEGIYKSTDAGSSWKNILPVLMGEDIIIHTSDTSKIMVSCGNFGSDGSGLYRSLDAGKNWTKLDQIPDYNGKTLLEMYASDPDIIFASFADALDYNTESLGLWRTDNFGTTWSAVHTLNIPAWQGYYSHWVAVHPTDVDRIIQAGVAIYRSNDGGESLEQFTLNKISTAGYGCDFHAYVHDPTDPNILYIAYDQGISRITGFGTANQDLSYGLQTAQFYNGFANSATDSNFALGGLQDNKTLIYTGSQDWDAAGDGDGGCNAVNPLDDNIVYLSFQWNRILKSVNHGQSFYAAVNGMEGEAAFMAPYVICPTNPNIMYSGRQKVFKTINGAGNWFAVNEEALDGNLILSMAVSQTNSEVVYVGTAPTETRGHIFRTTDGGDNWTDVTNSLPDRYPVDLAVDPDDDKTVYVVFSGFGTGHVYKSSDAGESWSDITGSLPDIPTLSITVDPLQSEHMYIGNDIGVYTSQDGGSTWNTFMEGLPEAVIAMDLSVSPANRTLRLATHGNGAYQRPLLFNPDIYLDFHLTSVPGVNLSDSALNFNGSVTNLGNKKLSDPYTLNIRITDEESSIAYFKSSTEINHLDSEETKSFAFQETFTPQDTGNYTIELIKLGTSKHPLQDTLRQSLQIIQLPSIARATVTKQYSIYTDIQGSVLNVNGDEGTEVLDLPFSFTYNGFDYDQIQISTNGWAELGTGTLNTERGLTSSGYLAYSSNENSNLAADARPTKTLAPWWDDLHTGSEGVISYQTTGSEPNRIFMVQWKRMQADASDGSSALINFQLHLYETTHTIEYHYGPVVTGTFSGDLAGASMGLKDHTGGDFHFYDVLADGTGRTSELTTDLSPLTDWPGPDSCFTIQFLPETEIVWQTQSSGTTKNLYGVNAISESDVWAVGVNGTVLHTTDAGKTWDDVWTQSDTVHFYDVDCIDDNTVLVLGYSIASQSILTSHVYKTTDGGSSWVLVFKENGTWLNDIEMFDSSEGFAVGDPVDNVWVMLETTDAGDTWSRVDTAPSAADGEVGSYKAVCWVNSSMGWYGSNMSKGYRTTDGGANWSKTDIPNYNDFMRLAFFKTGIGLAASGDAFQRTTDNGNEWQSMTPPDNDIIQNIVAFNDVFWLLSENAIYTSRDQGLSWELSTSTTEKMQNLTFFVNGNEQSGWVVGKNGSILNYRGDVATSIKTDDNLPTEIVLWQNYPNPFNSTTNISYDIPKTCKVILIIYNIMGQKVKTLVNKIQTPGNKVIIWDGKDDSGDLMSSGVYVYQLQTDRKIKTKKMLLLK